VFVICLLALAASVHFYALYDAKTVAANRALEASRKANVVLANVKREILASQGYQKSLKARVAADRTIFTDETSGIAGPGFTGVAGFGPVAQEDQMILNRDLRILRTVVGDVQTAQRTVGTTERAIAADDFAARSPQAGLAWSLVALIGSGLLAAATGPLNARRSIVRQGGYLPWASQDWQRLYAAGGWAQVLTVMLVGSAVASLGHPDDRDRYGEEWAGDMANISGKWRRAWWAITLRIFAPHGINSARGELSARKY